jgi:hypothetical protein
LATAIACNPAQTPFLHVVLLVALAAAAPALRLPAHAPAWAGPALAAVLLVPLLLRAQVRRELTLELPASAERNWLYEVDHRRGLLARLGNGFDSPERLEQVRSALDLPPPEPPCDSRFWMGAGLAAGEVREEHHGCGGGVTTIDRTGGGGWLRAEGEIPSGPAASVFVGGRLGYYTEAVDASVTGQNAESTHSALHSGYANLWVEREGPNVTLGLSALAAQLNATSNAFQGPQHEPLLMTGGHLRLGAAAFGLDLGFLDRQSILGPPGGHVDFSGAFAPNFQHLDSVRNSAFRYHVGLVLAPSLYGLWSHRNGDADRVVPAFGLGVELKVSTGVMVGADLAVGSGASGGVYARTTFGKR